MSILLLLFNSKLEGEPVFKSLWIKFVAAALVLLLAVSARAEIEKSPNDHREYRAFTLDNQMRVLAISDAESDVAAAALSIQIGGGDDFEHRPGIAHFLEHMLFIKTEKYPVVDEFRSVVTQNGGDANGYTSIERTNYNFSIEPGAFENALDRFAQFFIDPQLTSEFVEREREAVHAEFVIRKQSDSGMRWSAMKTLFNPDHPAAKFIAGNRESLGGDVSKDLVDFFNQYYSANLMSLVLIGPHPLDKLQQWATMYFSDVANSDIAKPATDEPLIVPGTLPAVLKVKTDENNPTMRMLFPAFDLQPHWRERPDSYISNLIGHEGAGSLLSRLKDLGFADGLYASRGLHSYGSGTYSIVISLTDSGLAQWNQVADRVFDYIDLVRSSGIERWRYDEQKSLDEIDFRFIEPDSPRQYVTYLADILPNYPVEQMLRALYVQESFDPMLIERLLAKLTPDNVMVVLTSPGMETDSITEIVEANYSLASITDAMLLDWTSSLLDGTMRLPEPNRFIPDDLQIVAAGDQQEPALVRAEDGFRLWHHTDTSFNVPRANFYFSIRSPASRTGARNSALLSLYTDALNEQLNEFSYPALLAGLGYELYPHSRGISVRLSGYSDNQDVLLETVLGAFENPDLNQEDFERHRADAIKDIENESKQSAYDQAIAEMYEMILTPYWTDEESLQALKSIDLADLKAFAREFLEQIQVVAISHGNLTKESAISMGVLIEEAVIDGSQVAAVSKSRVVDLPDTGPFIKHLQVEESDSAVSVYFQADSVDMEDRARYALLSQIIRSPFFSELRTRQQLGYVVFASSMNVMDVPGLMFVIQSPDKEPGSLHQAITGFLSTFHQSVAQMPETEFEQHRLGFISRILERDKALSERTNRYWRAIDNKDFDFDERERFAQAVRDLDRNEFAEFVKDIFHVNINSRIAVEAYGENLELPSATVEIGGKLVQNIKAFKQNLPVFPQI